MVKRPMGYVPQRTQFSPPIVFLPAEPIVIGDPAIVFLVDLSGNYLTDSLGVDLIAHV